MSNRRFVQLAAIGITIVMIAGIMVFVISGQNSRASLPESAIPVSLDESTAFLLSIPGGYLLFDTGYPWDFGTFRSALAENDITLSDIRYVFISHAHDDHAGFLPELIQSNPETRVIVHEQTATLLATGVNNTQNGGGLFNRWVYGAFRIKQRLKPQWTLTFPPYEVRPTDIIPGGDETNLEDILGIPVTVLYTPGHTSDSFSLVYGDTHIFCGDLASTSFNGIGGKYLTVFNENVNDVYASWSMILDRGIPTTIPSHGHPFPTRNLERYIGAVRQEDLVSFF